MATEIQQAARVQVLVIDDQHRVFFDIIEKLEQAMRSGRGGPLVPLLFEELRRLADYHFGTEERLMESYGYPLRDMHRLQHEAAWARLRNPPADMTAVEMLDRLKEWLQEHIAAWDAKLGEYLNDRGVD